MKTVVNRLMQWVMVAIMGLIGLNSDGDTITEPIRTFGLPALTGGAVFSPDGESMLLGAYEGAVLVDASTGEEIRTFSGQGYWVSSVAFSPDGTHVLTGESHFDGSESATLWKVSTGEEIRKFSGHGDGVTSVAFSPDGTQVLTGSDDNTARLWSVSTGDELRTFSGGGGGDSVAFSPDGTQVLTGSYDGTARLWSVSTGEELRTFSGGSALVAFSPDGSQVLTADDNTTRLWSVSTGEPIQWFWHASNLRSVAFSPDGTQVLAGSSGGTTLWNASTGEVIRTFSGHGDSVTSVAFSPDGAQVLTHEDYYEGGLGSATLWNKSTGEDIRTFSGGSDSVAFSPDGTHVLTGSYDRTARLWSVSTGEEVRTFSGYGNPVTSVAFSPDETQVLTGGYSYDDVSGGIEETARLWSVSTGEEIRSFSGRGGSVHSIAFSPDGTQVLTGSVNGTAMLWNVSTGEEVRTFRHSDDVRSVAFSPDGAQVLTGSDDNTARLWNVSTGEEIRTFSGHSGDVRSVAFSPDGTQVLTGEFLFFGSGNARLWNVSTGEEIRTFSGHSGDVRSVAFSPDGTQVLTGGYSYDGSGSATLWNVSSGGAIRMFSEGSDSVAFSPDGTQILTGSYGGPARLWPVTVQSCFNICPDEEMDTDGDGLTDCVESCNNSDPALEDTDGDAIPDSYETLNFLDPRLDDAAGDHDEDGLPNLNEFQLGTQVNNADSDGDGIQDGYEVANQLNPLVNDAADDDDNDSLTNLEEYERGTSASDSDDPPSVVYVDTEGGSDTGTGTESAPWATIAYAMSDVSRYTDLHPVTIQLAAGVYAELVRFVENVTLQGADAANRESTQVYPDVPQLDFNEPVIRAAPFTTLKDLEVRIPLDAPSGTVLLGLDDVSMTVSNVAFDGGNVLTSVGADLTFTGSSESVLTNCYFERLDFGIRAIESAAMVLNSDFADIRDTSVFMREPVNKQGETAVLNLGDLDLDEDGGANRFRGSAQTIFIDNRAATQLQAENNDFGLATQDEILKKISGNISICPFLYVSEQVACSSGGGEGEGEGEGENPTPVVGCGLDKSGSSATGIHSDLPLLGLTGLILLAGTKPESKSNS